MLLVFLKQQAINNDWVGQRTEKGVVV